MARRLRNFIDEYFLSWFTDSTSSDNIIPIESVKSEYLSLDGKFDWGMALGRYTHPGTNKNTELGNAISVFKYRHDKSYGDLLVRLLEGFLKNASLPFIPDLTIIVPPTLKKRKIVPMKYILNRIDRKLIGQYHPNLIRRTKILYQVRDMGSARERRNQLKHAFTIDSEIDIHGKTILLLDDIHDSGATLNECTRTLKNDGAEEVLVLVLAATGRGWLYP